MNNKAICCFCGDSVLMDNAVVLSISPNFNSEESQGFCCHSDCLKSNLDKSVVEYLHSDI